MTVTSEGLYFVSPSPLPYEMFHFSFVGYTGLQFDRVVIRFLTFVYSGVKSWKWCHLSVQETHQIMRDHVTFPKNPAFWKNSKNSSRNPYKSGFLGFWHSFSNTRKLHVIFLMNTFTCAEVSAGSQRLSVWRLGFYNTSLTGSNFISRAPEKHEKTQKRDSERNTEFWLVEKIPLVFRNFDWLSAAWRACWLENIFLGGRAHRN